MYMYYTSVLKQRLYTMYTTDKRLEMPNSYPRETWVRISHEHREQQAKEGQTQ